MPNPQHIDPRWGTLPAATRTRWVRVLNDYTPGTLSVMSRWALHTAARRGEPDTIAPITAYALRWHDWGFSPDDWWMLISALRVTDTTLADPATAGSALIDLDPSGWAGWPALLADHAPLAAVAAHRDASARTHGEADDDGNTRD